MFRKTGYMIGFMLLCLSDQAVMAEAHEVILLDQEPYTNPGPSIIVAPGDTITWINPPREGGGLHTITQAGCFTAEACKFDSEILQPGDEYSYLFSEPGVYGYRCRQHFAMKGTIIVESEKARQKRLREELKLSHKGNGNPD